VDTSKALLCGTFVRFHVEGTESYAQTAEAPQELPKYHRIRYKNHRIVYLKMTNRQTKPQEFFTPNHIITPCPKEMPLQMTMFEHILMMVLKSPPLIVLATYTIIASSLPKTQVVHASKMLAVLVINQLDMVSCISPRQMLYTRYIPLLSFYTPGISAIILSPLSLEKLHQQGRHSGSTHLKCADTGTFRFTAHNSLRTSQHLALHGILDGGLCYTEPLILPKDSPPLTSPPVDSPETRQIRSLWTNFHQLSTLDAKYLTHRLTTRAEHILWHQRLCHASDDYVYNAHEHIDGVPKFTHRDPITDQCPTCISAKLRKQPRCTESSRKATTPWQGLGIDFAFTGQKSKKQ
jgi:hypothetical protein